MYFAVINEPIRSFGYLGTSLSNSQFRFWPHQFQLKRYRDTHNLYNKLTHITPALSDPYLQLISQNICCARSNKDIDFCLFDSISDHNPTRFGAIGDTIRCHIETPSLTYSPNIQPRTKSTKMQIPKMRQQNWTSGSPTKNALRVVHQPTTPSASKVRAARFINMELQRAFSDRSMNSMKKYRRKRK